MRKTETAELCLGDAAVQVEFVFYRGSPGRYSGPPEDCYESEPDDVSIQRVQINGVWTDACDIILPSVLDKWADQLIDLANENLQAARDEYEIQRYEFMREQA
jgi:hypothetical protein